MIILLHALLLGHASSGTSSSSGEVGSPSDSLSVLSWGSWWGLQYQNLYIWESCFCICIMVCRVCLAASSAAVLMGLGWLSSEWIWYPPLQQSKLFQQQQWYVWLRTMIHVFWSGCWVLVPVWSKGLGLVAVYLTFQFFESAFCFCERPCQWFLYGSNFLVQALSVWQLLVPSLCCTSTFSQRWRGGFQSLCAFCCTVLCICPDLLVVCFWHL